MKFYVKVCFYMGFRVIAQFRFCSFFALTASPAMRGSTPLDVAAASVMDNNELALALREPDLEKVGTISAPSACVSYSCL